MKTVRPLPNISAKDFCWRQSGRASRAKLMGILNVTPDSFSDGGQYQQAEAAVERARRMVAEGADFIDVGAESTRPGAAALTSDQEWKRLEPVLAALTNANLGVPISVDTYKADVAAKALRYPVAIINDIWGLQKDPAMSSVVAEAEAGLVIMDNRAMVLSGEIYPEVVRFFEKSLALAEEAGIALEKIALDPGVGFGKSYEQNLEIISRLRDLENYFRLPLLLGVSRKSVIGNTLQLPVDQREEGTLAISALAVRDGVSILRIHDVEANRRAILMAEAVARPAHPSECQTCSDCISLHGMRFSVCHGALPEEKTNAQTFLVDVDLYTPLHRSADDDDLGKTVNYAEVYQTVRTVMEGVPVSLIETLAERIATALRGKFRMLKKVRVRLHKPEAPIPGEFSDVWVDITR